MKKILSKLKNSKALKIVCIAAAAVLVVALIAGGVLWSKYGRFIMAAKSVANQDDRLYTISFKGDYGFDKFLEKGGADSDAGVGEYVADYLSNGKYPYKANVPALSFGCSTVCAQDKNGNTLFGRNFDWENGAILVVHTQPKNGYQSVSTCCIDFLGFGEKYLPDGNMTDRTKAIASIYAPLDGMNEKGLMVAVLMAGDKEKTSQKTDKPDLTTTTAVRLLLDRAATVDEAIDLLKQYDINSSSEYAFHFAIADAAGKSVAVEYVSNEMTVIETPVLTNHYLAKQKGENGGVHSHERFQKLEEKAGATMEGNDIVKALEEVAQKNYTQAEDEPRITLWSWVYSADTLTASFFLREKFDHAYRVSLNSNEWFSPQ